LPEEARAQQNGLQKDVEPGDGDKPMRWGLTVTKNQPTREKHEADGEQAVPNGEPQMPGAPAGEADDNTAEDRGRGDADKEAIDALLGKPSGGKKSEYIIEKQTAPRTEDDVFREDFRTAPDESTLADYEAMPIEEFGAALLRGMGWDGKDRGPKVKQVKRRANQLGLGAKQLKGDEDLGAWNQKGGKSRPRLADFNRQEEKRREKRDERYRDSYKQERDRERDAERNGHRQRDRARHR